MEILQKIEKLVLSEYSPNPFSYNINKDNVENLLSNYLAMSLSFPYIQAGSQKDLIIDIINRNCIVPKEVEVTSVVGNFLSWDETGGNYIILNQGMRGLSNILKTEQNFHANQLRSDIHKLLKKDLKPNYSEKTKYYLKNLLEGFSSNQHTRRLAFMVAFEYHAEIMISSLWNSLTQIFLIEKEKLKYFDLHVGENDPAEAYHVELTKLMIQQIVKNSLGEQEFLRSFEEAYSDNFQWCESIKYS